MDIVIRRGISSRNQVSVGMVEDLQFRQNIEIISRRRDRDDMMQSTYVIENKEYHLKKETRNNLSLLSLILFVLILLTIPYVEDPDPYHKDSLAMKYNNETQILFKDPQLLGDTRYECTFKLKSWYYMYISVIIIKYLLSLA